MKCRSASTTSSVVQSGNIADAFTIASGQCRLSGGEVIAVLGDGIVLETANSATGTTTSYGLAFLGALATAVLACL
jgi:diacylglycerol kinase family enzyme